MRILVIRQGAIGDVVVTLPTLAVLREHHVDSHIEVAGKKGVIEIARSPRHADATVPSGRVLPLDMYRDEGPLPPSVTDYYAGFDLVLAYMSDPAGTVARRMEAAGAGRVVSLQPFPRGVGTHAADYSARILEPLGIAPPYPMVPELVIPRAAAAKAAELLERYAYGRPVAAVHPRVWGVKGWESARFVELARTLERRHGMVTLWLVGPQEEQYVPTLRFLGARGVFVAGLTLIEAAALLARCNLYVGCDTGISHLAAAAGADCIVLFGPTDPRVWAPRGRGKVVVLKKGALDEIAPADVEAAAEDVLGSPV